MTLCEEEPGWAGIMAPLLGDTGDGWNVTAALPEYKVIEPMADSYAAHNYMNTLAMII